MSFRINTNISAMNAHVNSNMNSRELDKALSRLSSGLKINGAADDASGMQIADSLRSQGNALGQAINNANDAIGIVQTADKAMEEQVKILDTIKTKATQAAQDGQSTDSRNAIQGDIVKLLTELDNIGNTTSFNGLQLLSGQYTNKEFQVGAYSRESIKVSIGATTSDKIGSIRAETSGTITGDGTATMSFINIDGTTTTLAPVTISNSAGTGLGTLAEVINKSADQTNVRARVVVQQTGSSGVTSGDINGLVLNGVTIGDVISIKAGDSDGRLLNAINAVTSQTGVTATIDAVGRLNLTSDGRGIVVSGTGLDTVGGNATASLANYGRLTLTSLNSRDIVVSGGAAYTALNSQLNLAGASSTMGLRDVTGSFSFAQATSFGAYANTTLSSSATGNGFGAGVTTRDGAFTVMDIADSASKMLDKIRASLGSTQNQLTSTINNISVTQVNVAAAESQIRDVDFASESANFSKRNILAQSGSYAMSQSNATQQNVLRLLQ